MSWIPLVVMNAILSWRATGPGWPCPAQRAGSQALTTREAALNLRQASQLPSPPRGERSVIDWLSRRGLFLAAIGLLPVAALADPASGSNTVVRFQVQRGTNGLGIVDVELFDQEKPATVQNFLLYVRSGAYSNSFMHRCVPGFIVQGGGFTVPNPSDTNLFSVYSPVKNYGNLTNEFLVGPTRSNGFGTLAMALVSGDPNSATAQWFFNLANNTNLDTQNGGFTVFGRVLDTTNITDGTNVLAHFNTLSTTGGIVNLGTLIGPSFSVFSDLPVAYTTSTNQRPTPRDLYYPQITILNQTNQPGQFPPAVTLISPAPNSTFTNQAVTLSGTASDDTAVARVVYQYQGGPLQIATGTTNWSATLTPPPGISTVSVQSVDVDGQFSANTASVTFLYVANVPLQLQVNGAGTVQGATNGQRLQLGSFYTLNAQPAPGNLFDSWTGSVSSASSSLTFQVPTNATNFALAAKFIPNPLPQLAGTYQGLFQDTNSPTPDNAGFINMSLGASGAFSGGMHVRGVAYTYTGQFDSNLSATVQGIVGGVSRSFSFQLNKTNTAGLITGSILGSTAELRLERAATGLPTSNGPPAGNYTFAIPNNPTNPPSQLQPGGHGYGTGSLAGNGTLSLSGTLGDSTGFTASAPLTRLGRWPLYSSLFGGRGVLLGWLAYSSSQSSNLDGTLQWIKVPAAADATYPGGFSNMVSLLGSAYATPGKGARVMHWVYGLAAVAGTDLQLTITNTVKLTTNNTLEVIAPTNASFKLSLDLNTGQVNGSFRHPWYGTTNALHGVVLKRTENVRGQFLASAQTGTLDLNAVPFLPTQNVASVTLSNLLPALSEGGLLRFQSDGTVTFTNPVPIPFNTFLDANGHSVVISGGGTTRLLQLPTNVSFTASGITFADGRNLGTNGANATTAQPGGDGCGAGLLNLGGSLTLSNCTLTNFVVRGGDAGVGNPTNRPAPGGRGLGAAICSQGGSVTLSGCTLSDNLAAGGQGNADTFTGLISAIRGAALGGALFSDNGPCEIQQTVFARNQARGGAAGLKGTNGLSQAGDGAGGALAVSAGNLHLAGSQCFSNTAAAPGAATNSFGGGSGYGGAVFVETNAQASIELSTFRANAALGGNTTLATNLAAGRGGAVFSGGTLAMRGCEVDQNTAQGGSGNPAGPGSGGAVASLGALTLNASTLSGNLAAGGAGAAVSTNGAAVAGGAGSGGAIWLPLRTLNTLAATNCTWASNEALGGLGAFLAATNVGAAGDSRGGALTLGSNSAVLVNLTIAFNQVAGTNGGSALASLGGNIRLANSILASNSPANLSGSLTDLGYNLSSDASFALTGAASLTNVDALLGPLTTNGGPTLTMAPASGSPAVDVIPPNAIPNYLPLTDERGISRPQTSRGDIGAVEVLATLPVFTLSPTNVTARLGTNQNFNALANGASPLGYFWLHNGAILANATSATLQLFSIQFSDAGTYAAVATNSFGSATSQVATLTINATPFFVAQPADAQVAPGGTTNFTVVTDPPGLSYTWLHDGTPVPGASGATLNIFVAQPGVQGGYQVIATNFAGSITSRVAALTFNSVALSIVQQPQSLTVLTGAPAMFTVGVSGVSPYQFQWYKSSIPILGATNQSLTIAAAGPLDAVQYYVLVSNAYLTNVQSSIASLTVAIPPTLSLAVQGTNLLVNCSGTANAIHRLLCATNLGPGAVWSSVATNVTSSGGLVTWVRPQPPPRAAVYYRAVTP